jgi:hypothetical protein
MNDTNTGGPAFPYSFPDGRKDDYNVAYEKTLRDYFAAKAMQSIILCLKGHDNEIPDTAEDAYRFADAMLKARTE